jgi:hypothetical protein
MAEILDIEELSGTTVLSGALRGQQFLAKLIASVSRSKHPQPLFLDFGGIDLMTSSFFRAGILPFRGFCVDKLNLYPVLANVQEDTLDEIDLVLEPIRDAVILCFLDAKKKVSDARIFGILDEKQRITFEAVVKAKEADAGVLKHRFRKSEEIGITGWNNRLAALVAKGLLIETQKGRGKLYRPVLELS